MLLRSVRRVVDEKLTPVFLGIVTAKFVRSTLSHDMHKTITSKHDCPTVTIGTEYYTFDCGEIAVFADESTLI